MKKVKGKYIRLTEEQLNKIVHDAVEKRLSILMEYAIPRSKFVENAFNMSSQIIENWCLVHYCTLTGRTTTKDHWKRELNTHMVNASKQHIKKNNSYDIRLKAIEEGFEWNDIPTTPDRVYELVINKFIDEGIVTTEAYDKPDESVMKCAEDCHTNIPIVISLIAQDKRLEILKYIETI